MIIPSVPLELQHIATFTLKSSYIDLRNATMLTEQMSTCK